MIDDNTDEPVADDARSDQYAYEHDDGPLSTAIVTAVADAEGVDPLEMDPLYGAVRSDLVDEFDGAEVGCDAELTFSYHGYKVTLDGDGEIRLRPVSTVN
ncbi:hypothetical protein BRC81_08270 [Halobacteriales archaeon QS_1_68_20]|nr:MAG: hypothetical protein BRC81_08270 [Halobacteriales archaeon QS_1_68_20]